MMLLKGDTMRGLVVVLLVSLWNLLLVHARSTGAPVDSSPDICTTMTPGHQLPASITDSPYSISLDSESYKPGTDLTVTITAASLGLKGIFLQMRSAVTQEILGSWSPTDSTNFKTVDCPTGTDNAVTHSNSNMKDSTLTFTWTPPATGGSDIYVAATFVQSYATFWINEASPVIPDACKALFAGVEMCSNHGICASNSAGGLNCICDPGYMGTQCDQMGSADACSDNTCMHGATCVPNADGGGYTCTCAQGYTGQMCNDMVMAENMCLNNVCQNGATCTPGSGEVMYTCMCAEGYIGPLCDQESSNAFTTKATTTAHGSVITSSLMITVTALVLAAMMNTLTLGRLM